MPVKRPASRFCNAKSLHSIFDMIASRIRAQLRTRDILLYASSIFFGYVFLQIRSG